MQQLEVAALGHTGHTLSSSASSPSSSSSSTTTTTTTTTTPIVIEGHEPFKLSYMQFDESKYGQYLQEKIKLVKERFDAFSGKGFDVSKMSIVTSPPKHFRQKCRFQVIFKDEANSGNSTTNVINQNEGSVPNVEGESCVDTNKDALTSIEYDKKRLTFVMWEHGFPSVEIVDFPIASAVISLAINRLLYHLNCRNDSESSNNGDSLSACTEGYLHRHHVLRRGLSAVHFLGTKKTPSDLLITLIYNSNPFDGDAVATEASLPLSGGSVNASSNLDSNPWVRDVVALRRVLIKELGIPEVHIIGRSKGCKVVIDRNFVIEKLNVHFDDDHVASSSSDINDTGGGGAPDGSSGSGSSGSRLCREYMYKQVDDGFSNPNGDVNELALGWIVSAVSLAKRDYNAGFCNSTNTSTTNSSCGEVDNVGFFRSEHLPFDLLEMYCGNGNHTVALAAVADRLLATEISAPLCKAATENLRLNYEDYDNEQQRQFSSSSDACKFSEDDIGLTSRTAGKGILSRTSIVQCDSFHFAQRIMRTKAFTARSISGSQVSYNFTCLLVDPPRCGLDTNTLSLTKNYRFIVYISCNPEALARDLAEILKTHCIVRMALFDQFAYTPHLELGVLLKRVS